MVAADALVARNEDLGRRVAWATTTLGGGPGVQRAVEHELRREGLGTASLHRDDVAERVRAVEEAGRARLAALASRLGLALRMDDDPTSCERVRRAATTAFVRLFDAGLLQLDERMVEVCPRCSAVVGDQDTEPVELEGEALELRLAATDGAGEVRVATLAPELLPGAVAVAVPAGHPAAGGLALVPLGGGRVPVLGEAVAEPSLVVPAHDPAALALARRRGLDPVPVVDAGGTVRAPGPLDGLPRYAARAAARVLLAGEGAVVAARAVPEPAARCRWCATVVVPVLGHHWFLDSAGLEVAAADAVREGRVAVVPPPAREALLARAGSAPPWCVAQRLWTGHRAPVTRCLDCGRVDVAAEPPPSCGRCMGEVAPTDEVLDARFVACIAPLADAGWPDAPRGPGADGGRTSAVVAPDGVAGWALPAAALGLWLAGELPFDEVVVVAVPPGPAGHGDGVAVDAAAAVTALVVDEGPRVARAAVLSGSLDAAPARRLVAAIDEPPPGAGDLGALEEACAAAWEAAAPGAVLGLLAAAAAGGLPPGAAAVVRRMAVPLLGG